jgi:hypothetical protein
MEGPGTGQIVGRICLRNRDPLARSFFGDNVSANKFQIKSRWLFVTKSLLNRHTFIVS